MILDNTDFEFSFLLFDSSWTGIYRMSVLKVLLLPLYGDGYLARSANDFLLDLKNEEFGHRLNSLLLYFHSIFKKDKRNIESNTLKFYL